jgi:hypothetical protein
VVCLFLGSGAARAEDRIEIGLLLGSTSTTNVEPPLQFNRGTTYEATVGWHVWSRDNVHVSIEVPFLASPSFEVATPGARLPKEYASLYLAPGVRVVLPIVGRVSAFGAVGAGYARYSESTLRRDGSSNPDQRDTNAGAVQFGGGVDVHTLGWLGFRGEVRDVYTGARNFSIPTPARGVHNVVPSVGFVLRF